MTNSGQVRQQPRQVSSFIPRRLRPTLQGRMSPTSRTRRRVDRPHSSQNETKGGFYLSTVLATSKKTKQRGSFSEPTITITSVVALAFLQAKRRRVCEHFQGTRSDLRGRQGNISCHHQRRRSAVDNAKAPHDEQADRFKQPLDL